MGGDITVRSEQGHGSCFTLTIQAPAVQEAASAAPEEEELPLPALHILLVEDIELNVIVARSVLEKLGNSVEVAMNATTRWRCSIRTSSIWCCWTSSCRT